MFTRCYLNHNLMKSLPLLFVTLFSLHSEASIVITGTRVIYPAGEHSVSVKLNNNGKLPVLIQSWVDNGDPDKKPDDSQAPFIITPPINRVDPGKGQTLRVTFTDLPLPTDRESVFWLNVLEIPTRYEPKSNDNYLQVAFRTRIKLFYRPENLPGKSLEAPNTLIWKISSGQLMASNNSAWNVSLSSISVCGKKVEGKMISPRGSEIFPLKVSPGMRVSFEAVNDYGAIMKKTATVQ
ncbi:molecular chaperone [Escherichia coli]|uniref:fimbrial biogenesis chaperone n=3 Tax=Escherichia coli TaxID=562 RepID=UPI001BFC2E1D|nr:fimbria/pilus periplasmic chaperone [Escherichia coli]